MRPFWLRRELTGQYFIIPAIYDAARCICIVSNISGVHTHVCLSMFGNEGQVRIGNFEVVLYGKAQYVIYQLCVNRQERTQAQQLREEQDEAYLESVRADQEKVSSCVVSARFLQKENVSLLFFFFRFFEMPDA